MPVEREVLAVLANAPGVMDFTFGLRGRTSSCVGRRPGFLSSDRPGSRRGLAARPMRWSAHSGSPCNAGSGMSGHCGLSALRILPLTAIHVATGQIQNPAALRSRRRKLGKKRAVDLFYRCDDVVQVGVGPFRTDVEAGITIFQVD